MMEKKQEPDRLIPCAGKCGETFTNPWPNDYCHRCGAAVEGDGATIPDLRSELAAVKAENTLLREALDKIVAHTYEQTTSDIACAALAPGWEPHSCGLDECAPDCHKRSCPSSETAKAALATPKPSEKPRRKL